MKLPLEVLSSKRLSWQSFLVSAVMMSVLILLFTLLIAELASPYFINLNTSPASLTIALLSIGVWHFGMIITIRVIYKRRYLNLVNPLNFKIKTEILWALALPTLALVGTDLIGKFIFVGVFDYSFVLQFDVWITWIIPIMIAILLQTSAEEFLFRGFFQQYLAGLRPNLYAYAIIFSLVFGLIYYLISQETSLPLWPMTIGVVLISICAWRFSDKLFKLHRSVYLLFPAIVWALMHYWNFTDPWMKFAALTQILLMGIIWADCADRTRTLWGPLIMHFINNFYLIAISGNNLEPSPLHIVRAEIEASNYPILAVLSTVISLLVFSVYYFHIRKKLPDNRPNF